MNVQLHTQQRLVLDVSIHRKYIDIDEENSHGE
jgi:hypothetical protein